MPRGDRATRTGRRPWSRAPRAPRSARSRGCPEATRLISVTPADQVLAAIERIQQGSFNQLPVVAGGHIVGLLTRNDLLRFVQLRAALHLPPTTGDDSKPPRVIENVSQPI